MIITRRKHHRRIATVKHVAALARQNAEAWRQDARALALIMREVNNELRALERGEDASSSRDFGRGVAHACARIRKAERDALERRANEQEHHNNQGEQS